jgi:Calpain family cysteine protease
LTGGITHSCRCIKAVAEGGVEEYSDWEMPNHNENGLLQLPPNVALQRFGNPTTPADTYRLHHRTYQKLFPQAPSSADLTQGSLGDCYLISALNSIVNCPGGPEAIEGCFLDRSSGGASGEVVMRLFDNNCVPKYFAISKSVVTGVGARSTIWVKLFEKGYAALFLGGSYSALETAAGAADGRGSDVLRAVLGAKADVLICSKNDSIFEKLIAPGPPNNKKLVRDVVFGQDDELVNKWWVWMAARFDAWSKIIGKSTCYRLEDWKAFIDGPGSDMPDELWNAVRAWMNSASPLPGRRGTGQYSAGQLHLYGTIKGALTAKKPVTAGTHQSVARTAKIIGQGLAGEGKAISGLVGSHTYAILDAKEEDDLLWVKLENPWKEWGVKYESGVYQDGPKAGRQYLRPKYDANVGDFWLEMCDLAKHFKRVEVSGVEVK